MTKTETFSMIAVALTFVIFIWILIIFVSSPIDDKIEKERNACESKEGIYYKGGFGASNCIFPPK